ncbi:MAG: hypothetical protein ACK55Z_03410 [bacterium]
MILILSYLLIRECKWQSVTS